MKIISFFAERVYGYLSIELNFNPELSIITGSNGSGKTTAIQLMQALLCPNFKDLLSIPFHFLCLNYEYDEKIFSITANNDSNKILIRDSFVEDVLEIDKRLLDELEFNTIEKKINPTDFITKRNIDNKTLARIKNLPSPIFVGLERHNESADFYVEDFAMGTYAFHHNSRDFSRFRREFKGSLAAGLFESEILIRDAYRKIKKIEDSLLAKLRDSILISSFEYISFERDFDINSYTEKKGLLSRKQEIFEALSKIGYKNNQGFTDKLNDFFIRLEKLLDDVSGSKEAYSIEWLTNKSQIDKLSKMLEIIDDNNSQLNKHSKSLNKFINIVNSYFKDSNKSIFIDEVGQLYIRRPSKEVVPIYALSSGERQIVVMFANVIFNKPSQSSRQNIIIIDEPEISLHIRWQEKFIDTLLDASKETQFILATHSPDIIGDYKPKTIKVIPN